jgi:hypothetical protein
MIFHRMIQPLDTERIYNEKAAVLRNIYFALHEMRYSVLRTRQFAPVFRLHLNKSWCCSYRGKKGMLQNHQLTFLEEYVKLSSPPPPGWNPLVYWLEYYPHPSSLLCSSICYILTQQGGCMYVTVRSICRP